MEQFTRDSAKSCVFGRDPKYLTLHSAFRRETNGKEF